MTMKNIDDATTEALIRSMPPAMQADARRAQAALKKEAQEAASLAVIDEIEKLGATKESAADAVERILSQPSPVPAAPVVERETPPAEDTVIAEAMSLGEHASGGAPDASADINAEVARLGEGA